MTPSTTLPTWPDNYPEEWIPRSTKKLPEIITINEEMDYISDRGAIIRDPEYIHAGTVNTIVAETVPPPVENGFTWPDESL